MGLNRNIGRQAGDAFYDLIERPALRYLPRDIRNWWINDNPYRALASIAPLVHAALRNQMRVLQRLTEKLHRAEVPLLAGTDTGIPGVLPGWSLQEDLRLLVEAGLSPYEALKVVGLLKGGTSARLEIRRPP